MKIDFTDETCLLTGKSLDGTSCLIVVHDVMIWPYGYGAHESTSAAWVTTGRLKLVFDPPLATANGPPTPDTSRSGHEAM